MDFKKLLTVYEGFLKNLAAKIESFESAIEKKEEGLIAPAALEMVEAYTNLTKVYKDVYEAVHDDQYPKDVSLAGTLKDLNELYGVVTDTAKYYMKQLKH